jgi:XTP/dITP diphosphohydrolase
MEEVRAVLASQNEHKLDELREALPEWEIVALEADDDWPDETGKTYRENARLKARFGRARTMPDRWVLGEDSGIECKALGGEPGLHSARWAPSGDQADALVERLGDETDRRARMVAELVAISPAGAELHGRGVLDGRIATERRGEGGFGYDPIFVPEGHEYTVAELGDEWKRAHSHRALAADSLVKAISRSADVARNGGAS